MKNSLLKLLTSNINYEDSVSYRRLILINVILLTTTIIFYFFAYFNIAALNAPVVALLDFVAGSISAATFYLLRYNKNITLSAKIASANLILFFIFFLQINGSDHFGLIWSIFIPIFVILINGRKIGFIFTLIFYAIIHPIAFLNIGVWQDGAWIIQDFIRFFISSVMLTYIVYMNEFAQEESDKELISIRKREQEHIQALKQLSNTDSLTELYNRRYFNDVAPKLLSLAQRQNQFLSFFILDVDNFKDYNDNYGHNEGDKVLKLVADAIRSNVQRGDDFVFRLGGEEFAGVILSSQKSTQVDMIERLCHLIESLKIEHSYSDISKYITVSIGIRTISPEDNISLEELYKSADAELYKAKFSGKNRAFRFQER